jgi:tRNA modification GTPase
MAAFAAVMTGKGTGAIATIELTGDSAADILRQILPPQPQKPVEFTIGKILLAVIKSGNKIIDQVTIGCESNSTYAINCHGNPLIVEEIMQLLRQYGVELLTTEQLLCKTSTESSTIALEAKLTLPKIKTLEGTQIVLNQINSGLTASAKNWLRYPPEKIAVEAKKNLEASQTAKLIIFGCRVVIAGPPNTGKSTLLNHLCGRQKAIVADIKGTTRDWVSANCTIGRLAVEFIDTAGIDEKLVNDIEKTAQQTTTELINQADIVLLVLDNSEPANQIDNSFINILANKKVLTVLNKSDLPFVSQRRMDLPALRNPEQTQCVEGRSPELVEGNVNDMPNAISISAKFGSGIDYLCDEIQRLAGVENFDPNQSICFTPRQEQLLAQLSKVKSKDAALSLIRELLSGPLNV